MNKKAFFFCLLFLCPLLFVVDIRMGSVSIPFSDLIDVLTGDGSPIYDTIIWQIRVPKAITALLVGAALSASGLLMQTLFRNPLAGPFVLGVSSGASLGVAIFVLLFSILGIIVSGWLLHWGMILFALAGAFVLFLILSVISKRINDSVTLLVAGMMIGSVATAVISVLQHISDARDLKHFINWTLGSLSNVTTTHLAILSPLLLLTFCAILFLLKPMDVLLVSEEYAQSVGVHIRKTRIWIIVATVVLTGLSTAFVGPIGFVGTAVPHVARGILNSSSHRLVYPATLLIGAIMMLLCDILSSLPANGYVVPINAVTALMGIPIILWIVLNKKRMIV